MAGIEKSISGIASDVKEKLSALILDGAAPEDFLYCALVLGRGDRELQNLKRFFTHILKCSTQVSERTEELIEAGGETDASLYLAALKDVFIYQNNYKADQNTDVIYNANLPDVIDNGAGRSIVLGIMVIFCARKQGWDIDGLSFPKHFLCRLNYGSERLIFDPATFEVMDAPSLRALTKESVGAEAELSVSYFEPLSDIDILIRLQNITKHKLIEMGDYLSALKLIEEMCMIAPDENRLFLDAGVMYAKTHQHDNAILALEKYLESAPYDSDRHQAVLLLQELKSGL